MKSIVILGAGFGGIRAALELDRGVARDSSLRSGSAQNDKNFAQDDKAEGWKIVLIDRNPFHIYYPKLLEEVVPNGKLKIKNVKCKIAVAEILKGAGIEFLQGEVKEIDCGARMIEMTPSNSPLTKGEKLSYDYLVVALGAEADYFGIPGLKENATVLRRVEDAKMISGKVEEFLKTHNPSRLPSPPPKAGPPSPAGRGTIGDSSPRGRGEGRFSIMIGGAGATGVELAAALAYRFRGISRDRWSVTLVEALPRVLAMLPSELSQYAHTRLERLGVKVMLDTCIKSVESRPSPPPSPTRGEGDRRLDGVEVVLAPRPLKSGESESELVCDFLPEHEKRVQPDMLVWTGGVRANPLLASCGMTVDRKGRVEVDEYMQVKGMAGVFAIGDNALLMDPATKQPVPGTAQAALEQGKLVATNIVRLVKTGDLVSCKFHDFSAIVPLADRDGVALIGGRIIRGFPAWLLRKAADCHYFASIMGWWKAVERCIIK